MKTCLLWEGALSFAPASAGVSAMHMCLVSILQEKVLRSQLCVPVMDSGSFLAYEMWLPESGKRN